MPDRDHRHTTVLDHWSFRLESAALVVFAVTSTVAFWGYLAWRLLLLVAGYV